MSYAAFTRGFSIRSLLPNWPLTIWMVAITLALGLLGGLETDGLIAAFNTGFGRALGEFTLILLPSFTLAAVLNRQESNAPGGVAAVAAPFAGAGMICPDTAYAALSPVAGPHRLDVAFGAYAGFKLLYPAGPLIVATGLGVADDSLMLYGAALLLPVWAAGVLWGRLHSGAEVAADAETKASSGLGLLRVFGPFLLMALLLVLGWALDLSRITLAEFITQPKGALLTAATFALLSLPKQSRRDCLDTAVRRTSSLLLIIGAASAFGAVLMQVVPLDGILPAGSGVAGIIALFVLTALFKLAQGSSMATFAAITPVAAPLVVAMDVPAAAAVLAICAGSFVAIFPNDSFYWLVRKDALGQTSEARAVATLSLGALIQALIGLVIILAALTLGGVA